MKNMAHQVRNISAVATMIVLTACGNSLELARYQQPNSTIAVAVQRASHGLFAEYERTVIVEFEGRAVAQLQMFPDTGGYSRANIYQLGNEHLVLLRDADASYTIDLATRIITKDKERRRSGTFLGSFDVDQSRRWRFIAAGERSELTTEFLGGS
jgi:hypothetical protein